MVYLLIIHGIDAKNLLCSLPVIRVSEAVQNLSSGHYLNAFVSDPGAKEDILCWCRINGRTIDSIVDINNIIKITILIG